MDRSIRNWIERIENCVREKATRVQSNRYDIHAITSAKGQHFPFLLGLLVLNRRSNYRPAGPLLLSRSLQLLVTRWSSIDFLEV